MAVIIFIAGGISFLMDLMPKILKHLCIFSLLLPVLNLTENYFQNDQSENLIPKNYGKNILKTLKQNSTFFALGDNTLFLTAYFQKVEAERKDITIYDKLGMIGKNVQGQNFLKLTQSPAYLTAGSDLTGFPGIKFYDDGLVIRAKTKPETKNPFHKYNLKDIDNPLLLKDRFIRNIVCHYHFALANWLFQKGCAKEGIRQYEFAGIAGLGVSVLQTTAADALLAKKFYKEAERHYVRVLDFDPHDLIARKNLQAARQKGR